MGEGTLSDGLIDLGNLPQEALFVSVDLAFSKLGATRDSLAINASRNHIKQVRGRDNLEIAIVLWIGDSKPQLLFSDNRVITTSVMLLGISLALPELIKLMDEYNFCDAPIVFLLFRRDANLENLPQQHRGNRLGHHRQSI